MIKAISLDCLVFIIARPRKMWLFSIPSSKEPLLLIMPKNSQIMSRLTMT